MPTYEYQCETCGDIYEVEQKITDPPLTKCTQTVHESVSTPTGGGFRIRDCGGPVKRLISGTSFVLKGGGWAKDGY